MKKKIQFSTSIFRLSWMTNSVSAALILLVHALFTPATAQNRSIWSDVDASRISVQFDDGKIIPDSYRTLSLQTTSLLDLLRNVPVEGSMRINQSTNILSLPMPDGGFADFRILESPVMESNLENNYPDFKTYTAQSVSDGSVTARIGWTSLGFHAIIFTPDGAVFIEPLSVNNLNYYMVFYLKDLPLPPDYVGCGMSGSTLLEEYKFGIPTTMATGAELRTFRLAVAATGEYTDQYSDNIANTQAAIVTIINQVNALYERDIAIRMILIGNNDDLIYTDPATDPFSNVGGNPCNANPRDENQTTIDAIIGAANYDIGHLFTGTNIGGCASLGSVCAGNKARGVSGVRLGSAFDIGLTAHEMGHQFNANHTFNSVSGTCGGQLASGAAYEPGSGTTIMSYAGTCVPDMIQGARDVFFHTHSYSEMQAFVTTGGGSGCVTIVPTLNNGPTVSAGPGGFTIPISTPFTLTGSGNDPDGDPLNFSWEQYDLGPQGSPNTPTGNAPLFRFFPPVNQPIRTFPRWSDILSNTSTMGEILPSYSRSMNFRLVARDNLAGGGGVEFASTSVVVSDAAGPFVVTSPNTSVTWCAGNSETVTWNVANTTAVPVSTANVNILLSTDGGLTFPITVLANTPNDGSQNITVPNNPVAGNARLMVQAAGNIFFDVSNSNFTINAGPAITSQPVNVAAEWGDNVSFSVTFTGSPTPSVQWQISTDGGSNFNNIPGATNSSLNLNCVTLDMNNYKYRAVLNNVCGPLNSAAATLTVIPRNTTANISVDPNPQQYSDLVDIEVTITEANVCGAFAATGADIYIGTQFMGSVVFAANGTTLEGTLSGVALLEPLPFGTAPTGQMAPGMRNVSAVLTGTNANFSVTDPSTVLEITPEDARAYYTGTCLASTLGVNNCNAVVTLSATIKDITAVAGDPDYDIYAGDIRNATVTFINRETNAVIAANVPMGLVDPNDATIAVATFNWNVCITGNAQTFEVGIIVGGYYSRNSSEDNVLVNVSKPLSNFVTGGGYIILSNSGGQIAGDAGSKSNYGFNTKFNRQGSNLQGNVNIIIKKTVSGVVRTYRIKSNVFTSLGIQTETWGGKSTINSKAIAQDITDPNNTISLFGNGSMQIKFTDRGEPGTSDSIAITIWKKDGGLWYSSNWNSTTTVEQVIAGGNLKINSNNSFGSREDILAITTEESDAILVFPNPGQGQFNVEFQNESDERCTMTILDIYGKMVSEGTIDVVKGNNSIELDLSNYSNGIYLLRISTAGSTKFEKIVLER
ncbi:MAG: M12 family metallo-peptidase [Bacteroidota bacterium]|nr:M12 family metallo-peptidase [Bacteroidota bacterium]